MENEAATTTAQPTVAVETPAEVSAGTAEHSPVAVEATAPQEAASQAPVADGPPRDSWTPDRIKELLEKEPEFKKHFSDTLNREAQRLATKERQKLERQWERERVERAREDAVGESRTYLDNRLATLDAETSAERAEVEPYDNLKADLQEAWKDPDWAKDYSEFVRANQAEANKLWKQSAEDYRKWVDRGIYDLRVDRKVSERLERDLPVLVEAKVTEKVNSYLQGMPVPPTGQGAAGDSALLERVGDMDNDTFRQNRERIYEAAKRRYQ